VEGTLEENWFFVFEECAKEEVSCCCASCILDGKIGRAGVDVQSHIGVIESHSCIRMDYQIFQEVVG